MNDSRNIFSNQNELISSADKEHMHSHRGLALWMTSRSGSGKTRPAEQSVKESVDTLFDDIFPLITI